MFSRREFLHRAFLLALGSAVSACGPRDTVAPTAAALPTASSLPLPTTGSISTAPAATVLPAMTTAPVSPTPFQAYLSVARGSSPAAIVRAAVDGLGGMSRFVKPGADVIIKPNICSASVKPVLAATTNPEVIAAVIQMCLASGARRVRVMDQPFSGSAAQAYQTSGIRAAVEAAGGQMEIMSDAKYVDVDFPNGKNIKKWQVYQEILKADTVINLPIAKTHDLAKLTLAMKGLMGVITARSSIHNGLDQRLADLSTVIKPTLNIIDGVRVLARNGPVSWTAADVVDAKTIIASHDIVAADAYAAKTLFQKNPEDIGYIRIGAQMGLGRYDFHQLLVKEVNV